MLLSCILRAAICAIGVTVVTASPSDTDIAVRSWGPRGMSSTDIMRTVKRSLLDFSRRQERPTLFKGNSSLEKSWEDASLLKFEISGGKQNGQDSTEVTVGVEVICTTCYVKANALIELTIDPTYNITQEYDNFKDQVGDALENITDTTVTYVKTFFSDLKNYTEGVFDKLGDGIDRSDFDFPMVDVDFDVQIPQFNFPDWPLVIQFDELELKGGNFEFLPVTIESAGVVLKAVLRVKIRAGVEVSTPSLPGPNVDIEILGIDVGFSASAGIEFSVWTHLAELTTNITVAPAGDETGCQLKVEESYQFVIGAAFGASVALGDHTWGPTPNTEVEIWGTTLTQCAIQASTTSATTAPVTPRQVGSGELTTTEISTSVTYTAVECMSTGLVNCPASLQTTRKIRTETTLTTVVPSGVDPTFPDTTRSTIAETIAFGTAAQKLFETTTTGSTPGATNSIFENSDGGLNLPLVLGLSIGLGVPVLIAIIAGLILWRRSVILRAYAQAPTGPTFVPQGDPYHPGQYNDKAVTTYTTVEMNYNYR
ncbi:hypothetical protein ABW20_dc0106824 [Dactylellina cionopaga]|nr:hypothetical protein ABW20_dc0106824 [Dactylellina cionopaga]